VAEGVFGPRCLDAQIERVTDVRLWTDPRKQLERVVLHMMVVVIVDMDSILGHLDAVVRITHLRARAAISSELAAKGLRFRNAIRPAPKPCGRALRLERMPHRDCPYASQARGAVHERES
jgi:hypothetical protein